MSREELEWYEHYMKQDKEELVDMIMTRDANIENYQRQIKELKEKVEYLKSKIENKDKWCQLIADIGYDYDGCRKTESLMSLIDELVRYALYSRDDFDYEEFLLEDKHE